MSEDEEKMLSLVADLGLGSVKLNDKISEDKLYKLLAKLEHERVQHNSKR
jgi:hypothetical protein